LHIGWEPHSLPYCYGLFGEFGPIRVGLPRALPHIVNRRFGNYK